MRSAGRRRPEALGVELGPTAGAAGKEADARLPDPDGFVLALELEQVGERRRLDDGIVGAKVELRERQLVARREQLVQPLARRVQLEALSNPGRDEPPAASMLLHP